MRKRKISVALFALMIAATGTLHSHVNVSAAPNKLTVTQPYENATRIKGTSKKGCKVKIKINKKTYQATVNKKGKYTIKVPKLKVGKKYRLTAYQKNKVYARKSFYAVVKNIKVDSFDETSQIITGYTAANAHVVLKCNGKSYTATSTASGYWKIAAKEILGKNDVEIKVFKKGKEIAHYKKTYQKEEVVKENNKQDDKQNNEKKPETAEETKHQHVYNIPMYAPVHFPEVGHFQIITDSGSYYEKEVTHDICKTCVKDLTQEYVDGIKNGTYKTVKIPKNNSDANKSMDILDSYGNVQWNDDMPYYEDFLAYGGWDHTCVDHKLAEETVTINAYFPGAIYQKWIVDQEEHDEQVIVGFKCSCGKMYEEEKE